MNPSNNMKTINVLNAGQHTYMHPMHKRDFLFTSKVTSQQFIMGLSLFFVSFFNKAFFTGAVHLFTIDSLSAGFFVLSLAPLLWLLTLFAISFITMPKLLKPLSIFLLIAGAFSAYFMDTYGVVIDKEMLRNALETDVEETMGLISPQLIAYVLVIGVIPSWLIIKINIVWENPWRELAIRLATVTVTLGLALLLVLSISSYYSSFFRNHKEIRFLSNPLGFVYAGISLLSESKQSPINIDPISQDALLGIGTTHQTKPVLVVFVLGETARAANFGLAGYKRNTTPLLDHQDIIYFDNFMSCGTSTAVSVPCIFSSLERKNYSNAKAKSRHGLLDFMNTAGIDVLWRDNNSGCKGTCDRVSYETFESAESPNFCRDDNCYDEVLLQQLPQKITGKNQLIVLHQKGSHGPAYDQRYPNDMRIYTPVCTTNQLQECTHEEVINAYDNTIRYTDYFIKKVINFLTAQQDTHNTVMVYVSDHGESLGENNLYLHGMPYAVAPDFQKHVPYLFWASDGFYRERGMDKKCLSKSKDNYYSHDNIFHSFLGLFDIKTKYYQPEMDMFLPCFKHD